MADTTTDEAAAKLSAIDNATTRLVVEDNLGPYTFLRNEPNLEWVFGGFGCCEAKIESLENRSVADRCYFFFSPQILAIIASNENMPGPKIQIMTAAKRNRNGAAVTKASGLLKIPLTLSESAVR